MLTMGLATDTGETMTLYDALESLTLRSADHIDELDIREDVSDCERVAELELSGEIGREFDQFLLGRHACLFEVALQSLAGVLFLFLVIGKLNGGVTIGFDRTNLRDNTRTSLNDGARDILPVGTEDGNHSDFFSN